MCDRLAQAETINALQAESVFLQWWDFCQNLAVCFPNKSVPPEKKEEIKFKLYLFIYMKPTLQHQDQCLGDSLCKGVGWNEAFCN